MNDGMNVQGPGNDDYETPLWLFKALDTEFGFTFDAAANGANHLCDQWTEDIASALANNHLRGHRVFCNPPYTLIDLFVSAAQISGTFWVLLLPARTGTAWFQALRETSEVEIRFLRKRIQFLLDGKFPLGKDGKPQGPRFDSILAITRPKP